jgi:RNA polymerase sigma-70 factor (ECF subfamily)
MNFGFPGRLGAHQLETLYLELAPALLAYVRSFQLDHGTSEDIVQRSFLELAGGRRHPLEARPYLFRMVRNAALNHHRDHARETNLPDEEPWFDLATSGVAEELDLRRALTALPEEQRAVVLLHLWGGLSFRELAAALDIPANTAASRYRYALAALKRTLTHRPLGKDAHDSQN